MSKELLNALRRMAAGQTITGNQAKLVYDSRGLKSVIAWAIIDLEGGLTESAHNRLLEVLETLGEEEERL